MLKTRTFSMALALALSAATVAPQTTLAAWRVSNASTSRAATSRAQDADKSTTSRAEQSDEDSPEQKPKP
ncbi:MAG: hypothetical protein ACJ74Q_06690, partial [Pyrinomonadaceae bacterium]